MKLAVFYVDCSTLIAPGGTICYFRSRGGSTQVKDYRLYFLDGFSGHIDEVEEFDAAGDEEAVAFAVQKCSGRAMELWHRHHKLRHWDETVPSLD